MGVANDHRLAAPQWQASQGRLVAHALGQTNCIDHGALIVRVGQIATAAQRRADAVAVDSDDGLEPGRRIDGQVQRLSTSALHESEHRPAPE
ncbi:hypothetical protein D3C87_2034540 [compost metagenome]